MKSDDVPQQASDAPGTALLALRLPAAESNELIHEHNSASQLASRLQAMPNPSPARPGLAQGFGVPGSTVKMLPLLNPRCSSSAQWAEKV